MRRRWFLFFLSGAALLFGAPTLASAQAVPATLATSGDHERSVRSLVEAYNAKDAEAMLRLFTDDVHWFSVDGATIGTESGSKEELRRSLATYLRRCAGCRSRLEATAATQHRVTAVEVANWQTAEGPRVQRSVAVYEFVGALIGRVYYFPAEESTDRATLEIGR